MFLIFWLFLIFGVFQKSTALECYECKGSDCFKEDLNLVTCSHSTPPANPTTPSTKPATLPTTPTTTTEKAVTTAITKEPEVTQGELDSDYAPDPEELEEIRKKVQKLGRRKRYAKSGSTSDPWKCFIRTDESGF